MKGLFFPRDKLVQVVSLFTGTVATGAGAIPLDNTIPQQTEGNEFMTLEITPKNINNYLRIDVIFSGANNASINNLIVALFQDATANALAVNSMASEANAIRTVPLHFIMAAGTVSATTFKIRVGGNVAGTTTFNGTNAAQIFGGKMASSIIITEYRP